MSNKALRTLGFAYKKLSTREEEVEKDLIFVGLQGMIDPPREEVVPLITQCHQSGIRIIMVTGDHLLTAKAVAAEIGIRGEALSGIEVDKFSEDEFDQVVERVNVYARINPGTKMRIVSGLKKHGHIVAMTGDGVNDAPAVKRADIGIAMGITGTDVAKEASDMILLDDNFSTVVGAIEEGRGIFENIRKFVNYLLSCNIGEVLVVFLAVIIFGHLPLTATMLLWINVVTDGLPAVALGMDPANKGILRFSPKKFQQ
jgi:Ca2+-transporting ATPase